MNRRFESLPWHDAVLLAIEIDRRDPGRRDDVVISIEWPDDRRPQIRFMDCYALDAKMNFGIVADDTVLSVAESNDTEPLRRLRDAWATRGADLSKLRSFSIETNSTASSITVLALSWGEE